MGLSLIIFFVRGSDPRFALGQGEDKFLIKFGLNFEVRNFTIGMPMR